ncbi:hypothetical protein ACGGZK_18145 [Agromyces sp. MMS24-K17]|uniref:hypothetical protein n=1 Tax=Agromyces sp. MMS24-K17 TaxID=3372850 RepID=UPI003754BB67
MTNSNNTPIMLKGWTATQWGRPLRSFGILLIVLAGLSAVCYFLVGGTAESVPLWLYLVFGVTGLAFIAGMTFFFSGLFKAIREGRAGYTTTDRLYPELPQLDHEGRILRTPAERATFLATNPR